MIRQNILNLLIFFSNFRSSNQLYYWWKNNLVPVFERNFLCVSNPQKTKKDFCCAFLVKISWTIYTFQLHNISHFSVYVMKWVSKYHFTRWFKPFIIQWFTLQHHFEYCHKLGWALGVQISNQMILGKSNSWYWKEFMVVLQEMLVYIHFLHTMWNWNRFHICQIHNVTVWQICWFEKVGFWQFKITLGVKIRNSCEMQNWICEMA